MLRPTVCSSLLFREATSGQGDTSLLSPLPGTPVLPSCTGPADNNLKSTSWCVSCLLMSGQGDASLLSLLPAPPALPSCTAPDNDLKSHGVCPACCPLPIRPRSMEAETAFLCPESQPLIGAQHTDGAQPVSAPMKGRVHRVPHLCLAFPGDKPTAPLFANHSHTTLTSSITSGGSHVCLPNWVGGPPQEKLYHDHL